MRLTVGLGAGAAGPQGRAAGLVVSIDVAVGAVALWRHDQKVRQTLCLSEKAERGVNDTD